MSLRILNQGKGLDVKNIFCNMRKIAIYRSKNKSIVNGVELISEKISEEVISEKVRGFNHNNPSRSVEICEIPDVLLDAVLFLIEDRRCDKNKLIEAVNDVQKDVYDLRDVLLNLADYIEEGLRKENDKED